MTTAEATVITAARDLLAELEKRERNLAFASDNPDGHNNARVECAAEHAKDAITAFLIVEHVYGDETSQRVAAAALGHDA